MSRTGTRVLDDARCIDCNYPLKGLPEPICPECGRRFDPAKPRSFVTPDDLKSDVRQRAKLLLQCALVSPGPLSSGWLVLSAKGPLAGWFYGLLAAAFILGGYVIALVCCTLSIVLWKEFGYRKVRDRRALAAFVIGLVIVLGVPAALIMDIVLGFPLLP